jgi:hypothetical protein
MSAVSSVRVPTDHGRFRRQPDPGRIPVARFGNRTADRLPVSSGRHAGISEPERLQRIRSRQPGIGVEYMADILDLADGAHQHRGVIASHSDEVKDETGADAPASDRVFSLAAGRSRSHPAGVIEMEWSGTSRIRPTSAVCEIRSSTRCPSSVPMTAVRSSSSGSSTDPSWSSSNSVAAHASRLLI